MPITTAPELPPTAAPLPDVAPEILDFNADEVEWDWFLILKHKPLVEDLKVPPPSNLVVESDSKTALFVSDLHMSDGSIVDDFHHHGRLYGVSQAPGLGELYYGDPKGVSLAEIFAQATQYLLGYLTEVSGQAQHDIVLNGDIFDLLELKARGSGLSRKHSLFFGAMAYYKSRGHKAYYLRGNHDFAIAPGPWDPREVYVNRRLEVAAQHGDQWDEINQPPGLQSTGAGIAQVCTIAEAWRDRLGTHPYPYAGVDNVRPQDSETISRFLGARTDSNLKRQIIDLVGAAVGLASDDVGAYGSAKRWAAATFGAGWLTVAGHTHIPVANRSIHYNTGSWQPTLGVGAGPPHRESLFHTIPLLLVYEDPVSGNRQEEFWVVRVTPGTVELRRESSASIRSLRIGMGYTANPETP